jgi:hypothetical protein
MIEVRVDGDSLEIELSGWDAINVGTWKTHRSVRVPVRDVTTSPSIPGLTWPGAI